jgi:hypothetical protein
LAFSPSRPDKFHDENNPRPKSGQIPNEGCDSQKHATSLNGTRTFHEQEYYKAGQDGVL